MVRGGLAGCVAPVGTLRSGQQDEGSAEEIERRHPAPVVLDPQVGCPGTRSAARLAGIVVALSVVGTTVDDRRRPVDVAELDLEVGDDRLVVGCAEIRRSSRDVAGVGLFDGQRADRTALGVIGRQQLRVGDTLDDERQFPGEVVGVGDPRVPAETAVGRHQVGGIAGQEHPAVVVPLGDVGRRSPAADTVDPHVEVGDAGAHPDQLDEPCLARVPRRVGDVGIGVGIAHRVHGEESRLAILGEPEEPAEHRIVDVDDAQRLATHLRPQVGGEIDRDAVGEDPASVNRNTEHVADCAVGAIGPHQVAGVAGVRGVLVDVPHHHRHTVPIRRDIDDLVALQHLRAGTLGATAQDRFQPGLGHEQTPTRAQGVVDALVEAGNDVGELAPGEAVHADDRTLGEEFALGLFDDLGVDTSRPEQLQGPHMEVGRSRHG